MSTITHTAKALVAAAALLAIIPAGSTAQIVDGVSEIIVDDGTEACSCSDCQDAPQTCGCRNCCGPRFRVFGEYLYLRAGDSDIAYAAEVDGVVAPPVNQGVQLGPIGIVEQQYEPAYRAGFGFFVNPCTSIGASYTSFQSHAVDSVSRTGQNVIRSLVTHPLVNNAAADWLDATASHDIDFQLADMEYRRMTGYGPNYEVNLLVGGRYAHMDQDFRSLFSGNGNRTVDTDISFDGGGLRVGMDFNRRAPCRGIYMYGAGSASFLASTFSGHYRQGSSFDTVEVNTSLNDHRIVSILDLEFGVGWESCAGRVRVSGGYLVSAWFNTINTASLIDAVHVNDFSSLGGETTTFDGLTSRIEFRF